MIKIYGIKNCNTMKKAFDWFNDAGLSYDFIDYKKTGADATMLQNAIAQHGWEKVINRRGTTWRKLDAAVQGAMDDASAVTAALDNPSMIKRPLIIHDDAVILGFNADDYAATFGDNK